MQYVWTMHIPAQERVFHILTSKRRMASRWDRSPANLNTFILPRVRATGRPVQPSRVYNPSRFAEETFRVYNPMGFAEHRTLRELTWLRYNVVDDCSIESITMFILLQRLVRDICYARYGRSRRP